MTQAQANASSAAQAAVTINPANGEVVAEFPYQDAPAVQALLQRAKSGFERWSAVGVQQRAEVLVRMAAILRRDAEALARGLTMEMGKPIKQARGEIAKCADLCVWYAEHGPAMLQDEGTLVPDDKARVAYRPLGAVLAVMPWNFPAWQVFRGAVPILLGGNGYVLKHAPNVVGTAMRLAAAWEEAGLPAGAFEVLNVTPEHVAPVIQDARIAAVTVTASVRAGAAIAAIAGAALKKTVLELGGSDPFIVLADADLDGAVAAAVQSRYLNSGQVCIAAKRLIVEAPVAAAFTERFVAAVRDLKVGDPLDEANFIGPMARHDLREELHQQVEASVAAGARLLAGGRKIEGTGAYYEPTVLGDVKPGMAAFDQETFGPVAALIVADDAEHALALANQSEFGLSGAVWSADLQKARDIAARLQVGGVFINGFSASDARVPIGGVRKSGYGRELSHFGVREFTNAQTVWEDKK